LELNIEDEWGVKGFDAVIGNPPYSTNPSEQNAKPLHNLFIEKYIDICQYMLFVVPSRWFVGGKGLDAFRQFMMNREDITTIVHEDDAKRWFGKNVEIKGGVNYFVKDTGYTGGCMFNTVMYKKLSKYDCIVKPEYHRIIDLVIALCVTHNSLDTIYKSRGFFGYMTNDKRLKEDGETKCYVSYLKSKQRYKFVDDFVFNDENMFWKVITPKASFKGFSGFGFKFVGKPNEIYTDSYISFKVNSEEEANYLVSYLNTQFVNHLLSIRKISQDISKKTIKWIPLVPLDREWNDEMVCDYFNIDKNLYM
jgi:site-specific DNA-methyltransferase (adenine-specific)